MKKIIYFIEYVLGKSLILILQLFPLSWSFGIARFFGRVFYQVAPKRREIALNNLRESLGAELPESRLQEIAKATFENVALGILDLFLMDRWVKEADERFKIEELALYKQGFDRGNGKILISTHLGSWELLSFLPMRSGYQHSVVVKDVKNPWINREVNAMRRKNGLVPVPKKNIIRYVLKELKSNRGVPLLIDQWAGPEGIWMDFFGRPTSTTSLPARLAKQTGASISMGFCVRKGDGQFEIEIEEPLSPEDVESKTEWEITKILNEELEKKIRQYPEQWSWAHRRWKPKPNRIREVE